MEKKPSSWRQPPTDRSRVALADWLAEHGVTHPKKMFQEDFPSCPSFQVIEIDYKDSWYPSS
jgi:hypothetical protein